MIARFGRRGVDFWFERVGVGDNCEVGGSISGDDVCRFLVKNRMVGRDFAFLMILRMADME